MGAESGGRGGGEVVMGVGGWAPAGAAGGQGGRRVGGFCGLRKGVGPRPAQGWGNWLGPCGEGHVLACDRSKVF